MLQVNPDLPVQTQTVIDKAMAKDREERYQTAVALAEAVQQLLTIPPVVIKPPLATLQLAQEMDQAEAGAETLLDTPPEELPVAASPDSAVEEKTQDPAPAPLHLDKEGAGAGRGLPAWTWWAGAIVVVLLLIFGIRAMLGGGGETTPQPAEESRGAIVAVVPTETATRVPMLPTLTATIMPEPANTATAVPSPTATLDPNVPPPDPTLGSVRERPQDKVKMVYVPPGTFPMGSTDGDGDEQPVHDVTLDGFWIDETEVTNAHYAQCVEAGECEASFYEDSAYNGDNLPVVGVFWNDADAYCNWAGGQLPTEAQWEYAARGPDGNTYPWGEEVPTCDLAQYGDCDGQTVPTGSYPEGASWAGALDMAGNVWEWVSDWYDSDAYASAVAENPTGPESGDTKVLRGGSWIGKSINLRGANRGDDDSVWYDDIGFRCDLPGS